MKNPEQFSHTFKVDGYEKTFTFIPNGMGRELRYTARIKNESFNEIRLYIDNPPEDFDNHGIYQWKIEAQKIPNWVHKLEMEISDVIEQYLGEY